ncbi:MAG TPA: protein kinase, partial [Kofleriaceae bacterium]|nr:protein kinase [Kofleriaceae bacterium]
MSTAALDEHIRVAAGALARGLIDARGFVDAIVAAGSGAPLERVWVAAGRLTAEQLADLRGERANETVAVGGDTALAGATPQVAAGSESSHVAALHAWLAKASVLGFGHVHDVAPPAATQASVAMPSPPRESQRAATQVMRITIPPPPGAPAESAPRTEAASQFSPPTEVASAAARAAAAAAMSAKISEAKAPAPDSEATTDVRAGDREKPATKPPQIVGRSGQPRVRYERRELLGIGGLGQVTACFDAVLGRRVAVKVARTDQDPTAEQILEREARIIALLEHPNIMPVYDAGSQPGVGPYYVMRLVDQASLDKVLEKIARGDAAAKEEYGLKRLLRFFVQICHAVDYAHARGVIHCDLKPANVLLGEFGEVLVVDWGLAYSRKYPDGPRGGTPGFMAPEQVDRARREFDARTDVFALGVILYMILCLRPPFAAPGGADVTTMSPAERYKPAKRPSEIAPHAGIPREVEDAAMKALALVADDRYPTARALADDIDAWLEGRREAERRRAAADDATAQGDELAARVEELEESLREHAEQLASQRAVTAPWVGADEKQPLWDLEDMRAVTDALRVRTLQAAVGAYEQALEAMPDHAGARKGLARMYRLEVARAEAERHEHDRLWFQQLVQRYDDAGDETAIEGRLSVEVAGDCELELFALAEDQRRLQPRVAGVLDGRPRMMRMVPAGRYLIECRAHGRVVRWPVVVTPDGDARVSVDAGLLSSLADDEVVVPGGAAPLGEALALADARTPAIVDVPTFVARRFPVTFGEYAAFAELHPEHAPSISGEADHAVCGVTHASAVAYAAWVAARTGVAWR